MTDPMSRREIEDVLSSIRRLVTQDGTGSGADAGRAGMPSKSVARPDKLILSPAFRVLPAGHETEADDADVGLRAEPNGGRGKLESTIAELEAAIGAIAEEWEPDCGDALPQVPESGTLDAPIPRDDKTTQAQTQEAAAEGRASGRLMLLVPPVDTVPADALPHRHPGEIFSRPTAPAELAPPPPAPDFSLLGGKDAPVPSETLVPVESDAAGPAVAGGAADAFDEAPMHVDAPIQEMPDNVRPFSPLSRFAPASVENPEAPPAGRDAAAPPVAEAAAATFMRSSGTPRAEDDAPIRPPAPLPQPEPESDDGSLLTQDDSGDVVMDEAMLRDLVADILREELQGVLGQRITRNVRKMVRAEVARALASRNLD